MGHGEEERPAGISREPRLTQEERERIDKIACFVARDRDGELTESILWRLLRITNNQRRWGFMSPDHPHNAYYLQRKVSERCRLMRPPLPAP